MLSLPAQVKHRFGGTSVYLQPIAIKGHRASCAAASIDGLIASQVKQPCGERCTAVFKLVGAFEEAHKHLVGITGQLGMKEAEAVG